MSKNACLLLLMMVLVVSTGCQTIHGMGEDVQNMSNPDLNGWNTLEQIDGWIQKNLW